MCGRVIEWVCVLGCVGVGVLGGQVHKCTPYVSLDSDSEFPMLKRRAALRRRRGSVQQAQVRVCVCVCVCG